MATSTSFAVSGDFETANNGGFRFRSVVDQVGPPSTSPPPSPQMQQGEDINVKTCRICFDTTTSTWDSELGRLLSPCRCRGSSKYVHEECLNSWRRISANAKSYYECNTCGYKYKFRRLAISRWVGSRGRVTPHNYDSELSIDEFHSLSSPPIQSYRAYSHHHHLYPWLHC